MPNSPIRVLIVEDSLTIRHHIAAIVEAQPGMAVAGTARTGTEAVALAQQLTPDVISMDVKMPDMDGLEATRHIMQTTPTPVVVVSGLLEREIDLSFRALQAGALAVLPKPPATTDPSFDAQRLRLLSTLQAMADVKVVRRWHAVQPAPPPNAVRAVSKARLSPLLIAVAASAGGPSALATLVRGLEGQLPVPMVIVQHMPTEFLGGLARWLNRFAGLPVRIAANERLHAGTIYLAPANYHLRVRRRHAVLSAQLDPERGLHRHHPAADILFESVAAVCGARSVGVVLSGMGTDGAHGLLAMRQQGAYTYAQDAPSSIVHGMPGAAASLGAVEQSLPPARLAAEIRRIILAR